MNNSSDCTNMQHKKLQTAQRCDPRISTMHKHVVPQSFADSRSRFTRVLVESFGLTQHNVFMGRELNLVPKSEGAHYYGS